MLNHLRIKNLALVADLDLELRGGFHAISGETGAGKSILIGALNLLLGERADRTLLRAGAESCSVEGVLDVRRVRAPLEAFFEGNGLEPCEGGQLILKRTFSASGANRQFVNGSPTTLQVLVELGLWLVDIHGPHDHQSLFRPARQLELLDAHAGLDAERDRFAKIHERRAALNASKSAMVVDDETHARRLEMLRHQVEEIAAARLQPGEDRALAEEHERTRNAARLLATGHEAKALLADNDDALLTRLAQVGRLVRELGRLDSKAMDLAENHEQAIALVRDLHAGLSDYLERVEVDPARLRELEVRLDLLQSLRRKYGGTLEDVLAAGDAAREELIRWGNRNEELARLNDDLARVETELADSGRALTAERRRAMPRLAKAVVSQLRDLGFARCEFDVESTVVEPPGRDGYDRVEFRFAPNLGEPMLPLRAIASSGEMARVMLALKTVLAAQDDVPVVVFDEVDANVGGETAHAVGRKMREIGANRQVLAITHLAPVAASAEHHLVVTKGAKDGRTVTEVRMVAGEERVAELARMLGGGEAAARHARALLAEVRARDRRET